MKAFLVKNKVFYLFLISLVLISSMYFHVVELSVSKYNGYTIVVDAGHGGRDGGSVGINGTIEKEINLEYALALKDKLVKNGFRVELTRRNDDGLYSLTDKNKKANPNLVVSIHMNSFTSTQAKGAMTYYRKGDEASKTCADLIQKSFNTYCGAKWSSSKVGDYYMLNCSYYTAVLIECGFISNPDEENLLNTDAYKNKIIESIYKGILLYFGNFVV